MAEDNIETLTPRYKFILNQYDQYRLSRCPICNKLTHMRKFALLIHIDDWGLLALGKTCRYCSGCELIIAHKDELEDELVHGFEQHSPEVIGNPYQVIGTVEKKWWKGALGGLGSDVKESLKYTAPLKETLCLKIEGGGWMPVSMMTPKRRSQKP